jgi:hypothetical protein
MREMSAGPLFGCVFRLRIVRDHSGCGPSDRMDVHEIGRAGTIGVRTGRQGEAVSGRGSRSEWLPRPPRDERIPDRSPAAEPPRSTGHLIMSAPTLQISAS